MGVLLQAFFRPGDNGVPCPADGDSGADWWWDHLAKKAHTFRRAGFTAVWLPPVWKGASGIQSVGYDPFDDYDLGSKNQRGTVPTRYGTREQLARCVAMLRANDLDVYVDLVESHRGGGSGPDGKTFRYVDAEGNPDGGGFPKGLTCFHGPEIPRDPHVFENFSFGSRLAPIHSKPQHAVTFVENHDTDTGHGPIRRNKPQAYAYILTSEGYPCVYYKDYSTDPGCYGLKKIIDNLIWIHEKLADGPTRPRLKDHDVYAYERLGGPHLLVGLNNNETGPRTITVDTDFGPNAILHDYTGYGRDVRTDGHGRVTITIPGNVGGFGYVCYSRIGINGDFAIQGHSVTQDYEGAQDLDIKPAESTRFVQVCRVWVVQGTPIRAEILYDASSWTEETGLVLELTGPTGTQIECRTCTGKAHWEGMKITAGAPGWYTFRIRLINPPPAQPKTAYKLTVTYQALQEMCS